MRREGLGRWKRDDGRSLEGCSRKVVGCRVAPFASTRLGALAFGRRCRCHGFALAQCFRWRRRVPLILVASTSTRVCIVVLSCLISNVAADATRDLLNPSPLLDCNATALFDEARHGNRRR